MNKILDAKGLNCPLPVLKTRKALRDVPLGDMLTVLTTDPASTIDVRHFCNVSGQELQFDTRFTDHYLNFRAQYRF